MKHLKKLTAAAVLSAAAVIGLSACKSSNDDHSGDNHASDATSTTTAGGTKPYALKTCIVTDEAFDHGTPFTFVHNGQEIKMCCDGCKPDFDKEPAKYLKKLETASKK
jgi:hypothetical protein